MAFLAIPMNTHAHSKEEKDILSFANNNNYLGYRAKGT
jgi:hypothetical protein